VAPEWRMAVKPLADLIDDLLAPALAAQGFAGRAIVSLWPEIVGERLAQRTRPLKIDWPRRRPAPGEASEPATMVIRVESAFALEMQQLAPIVLDRVNTHLGWRAVAARVERQVAGVADPALRASLERLGRHVAQKQVAESTRRRSLDTAS
jgi:hypothetical protein